ncbi:conserved hypothetical protein [Parafrankia sp. EAN1pec]|uniref:thiopeptide-type bacteriocin biosynthesis protein n=1 Tax=Parafrankia sp. (strain EAN1pec) TaxID=298653 RepID=UPI0000544093|nr:conserved hypothetical protein [Frankia sp. EAN1pec]
MDETPWRQINITWPGPDRHQRERQAIDHLARVLPAAEASSLISSWFFLRKGPWRVRYLLTQDPHGHDPLHPLLTDGVRWTSEVYEPETVAFGGPASLTTAHTLFHQDSRHLLAFLDNGAVDRRGHSLVLCTALMRTAGLDFNEQGDVWARVAAHRSGLAEVPADPEVRASFTSGVRHLLLGTARADLLGREWLHAFEEAGRALRTLRERGDLARGIRTIIALHVIFHWNRLGLPAATQATLAQAAQEAVFSDASQ